jgi:hypothetical protein
MKLDYTGDHSLAVYLESSKSNLYEYYETHYADKYLVLSQVTDYMPGQSTNPSATPHSPQENFTSHFQWKVKTVINELDDLFKLPQEDFDTCNQIYWWMGPHTQFPNVFWLTQDIFCIPDGVLCYHLKVFSLIMLSDPPWLLSEFSQEVATQSHCDRQVFGQSTNGCQKKLHLAHTQSTAALHY